ncbi:Major facilitator superfamily domain general substrate transporter [Penicillium hordei]|uniref:Major facilitator superfamily domain general substrate transporter n=1 Tax=Penicillium hordei TaxID=40994 RepID=A0AAD6H6Z2_9EURO|nr:Major facilitator superfamily domain general substrate transporter [Penicillium hordei]KAJ5608608.1 Major facilitator superfamily domain general substrate transporter [Penicillium hordei]
MVCRGITFIVMFLAHASGNQPPPLSARPTYPYRTRTKKVACFFLGSLFPGAVVIATKLLPRHLHVISIGFVAAFGGSGAAILPSAVGVLAQAKGVKVLQPFIIALSGAILITWLGLPRVTKVTHSE